MNELTTLEEFDITGAITMPHLLITRDDILLKKRITRMVLAKKNDEFLLINSNGFETDFVFAGLTLSGIQFIASNGPDEYKKSLLEAISDKNTMQGVFEIAKAMDKDLGENATQNQQRVQNVIQYIKDNQIAFQF